MRIASTDGTDPYALAVYDDSGTLVESLVTGYQEGWGTPEPWNETLSQLYHAARNTALNVDEVIDNILKDVTAGPADDDIPF